jgi:hypothetical protein
MLRSINQHPHLDTRPFKKAQWGLVGANWEHTPYFEAARARTEQTFSLLKFAHITNLVDLKWGPRREPMVKILFAKAGVSRILISKLPADELENLVTVLADRFGIAAA